MCELHWLVLVVNVDRSEAMGHGGTVWLIALWRNQWHTRYISINATWTLDTCLVTNMEWDLKFWSYQEVFMFKGKKSNVKFETLANRRSGIGAINRCPLLFWFESGKGLRLSRHSFLPLLIELWTRIILHYLTLSYTYIVLHCLTLSYIWRAFQRLME